MPGEEGGVVGRGGGRTRSNNKKGENSSGRLIYSGGGRSEKGTPFKRRWCCVMEGREERKGAIAVTTREQNSTFGANNACPNKRIGTI